MPPARTLLPIEGTGAVYLFWTEPEVDIPRFDKLVVELSGKPVATLRSGSFTRVNMTPAGYVVSVKAAGKDEAEIPLKTRSTYLDLPIHEDEAVYLAMTPITTVHKIPAREVGVLEALTRLIVTLPACTYGQSGSSLCDDEKDRYYIEAGMERIALEEALKRLPNLRYIGE
ncbi:hypothetical protein V5T82_17935 [Magnetovibrio sp. PR-2]|uniref:hypothetical protein n=1 Tax=Magnetovibrio sp. PR-2 TaxID=3120356 RepID=UPI002FCE5B27